MAKGIFITGTGTGVGKTMVTAAIIRAFKSRGLSVCGMKPMEAGCERRADSPEGHEGLVPLDGLYLREASDVGEPLEHITPVRFEAPLSPLAASIVEGRQASVERVFRSYNELVRSYDLVVVEGIGGLLVPIKKNYFVADMIQEMNLPCVVVASPFLGTINHTLLTIRCAQQEGIKVLGVIMNNHRPREGTIAEETNPSVLEELLDVPLIGTMPYIEEPTWDNLQEAALQSLDLALLLR